MAIFGKAKKAEEAKKAAEEAARKAKAEAYMAKIEKSKATIAKEKAEKELKEMKAAKAREALIAKQRAMRTGAKPGQATPPYVAKSPVGAGAGHAATLGSRFIGSYTVKKGDTLSQIAKQFYGSTGPKYWKLIQNANVDKIKDVNVISPGQVFRIPVLPEDMKK